MRKPLIVLCLCLTVIAGCSRTEKSSRVDTKSSEGKKLLIGLVPERDIFDQMSRYEPLADYLSKKTGVKIEFQVLTRYGDIVDNFTSMHLDGAFFGSFTYVLAHARLGVEPVARPEDFNGDSTYCGLIFVRRDSGIKTAKDMKGKTFAFVDKSTTAGYLLPLVFFKENGIKDYKAYFKEAYFTGTHEDAVYDVLNKRADIGATKNTVFYQLADSDKRIADELVVLTKSNHVPQNGLAVRKDLDSSIKSKLKEALLNMHDDKDAMVVLKKFGASSFVETKDTDYKGVYEYMKEINPAPSTNNYLDD
ncbi:MAG: phosphate/phosphite/phosphonate ABC transporter substrate-binding protein [Nitrospirae bacterium]|nr:phosphate/phosphite/phosphonate ABC transporter substrate-binding protein [Nitrospirota bacterium]